MDRKEVSKLKESIYQKEYRGNTSRDLFNSAWRQYVGWLRGAIDDPHDELDITNWLDKIISEKVNNPKSKYYIMVKRRNKKMATIKKATIIINEKYELKCDEYGFTLWVEENGFRQWILDASCFSEDGEVRLGYILLRGQDTRLEYDKENNKLVLKNKKR